MSVQTIRVVIDGATGRLGTTQHLRALVDIRREGGLPLKDGGRLIPEPVLLGRNAEKLAALAKKSGGLKWSTDRDAALADPVIAAFTEGVLEAVSDFDRDPAADDGLPGWQLLEHPAEQAVTSPPARGAPGRAPRRVHVR